MNQQEFINAVFKRNTTCFRGFPDRQIAEDFIDELFFFLFGTHEKKLGQDKLADQYEGIKSTLKSRCWCYHQQQAEKGFWHLVVATVLDVPPAMNR